MSPSRFHKAPGGPTKMLYNQPLCKRADFGKYLGIEKVRDNFKNFKLHSIQTESEILAVSSTSVWTSMLGGAKNPQDVFIDHDRDAIEMAAQFKTTNSVALVKWLSKKSVVENTGRPSATY